MVLEASTSFLDKLFNAISQKNINVSNYVLDHIAYRTESDEVFQELQPEFTQFASLAYEAYFSDNMIQIYKFNQPLIYKGRKIFAIELIGPNAKIDYPTGFEHAEFCIKENFEDLLNQYPDLDWNKSAMNRADFPLLKLELGEFLQVKFNHIPVLEMANKLKESAKL